MRLDIRVLLILLLLFAFSNVKAGTVTLEAGWPLALCDAPKFTHYADNSLVVACTWPAPVGAKKVTVANCPRPKLVAITPGNYNLTCT